jgi:Ca2+-transporting ATPase
MALVPVLLGWPVALFPLHIAFLELVIDPACSMVFENEPAEADLMTRPPRDASAPLFAGATLWLALLQGLGVLGVALGAYAWGLTRLSENEARAFVFATLVAGNLALIFSNRSRAESLLAALRVPNRTLWIVTALALVFLGLALYAPWAASLFRFGDLPLGYWGASLVLGFLSVLWFEVIKLARRQRRARAA